MVVVGAELCGFCAVTADGVLAVAFDLSAAAGVAGVRNAVTVDLAWGCKGWNLFRGGLGEGEDVGYRGRTEVCSVHLWGDSYSYRRARWRA